MAADLQTLQDAAAREFWTNLAKRWGSAGLLGAGLGAGFRGLQGASRVHRELDEPEPDWSQMPNLPIRRPAPQKLAADNVVGGLGEAVQQGLSGLVSPLTKAWSPKHLSSPGWHPLFLPGVALAGGMGAYGGWNLADRALDSASHQATEEELQKAKQDYELALAGRLGVPSGKTAEWEDPITQLGKRAATLTDATGGLTGLMLLGMGAGALGSGKLTYDLVRKRQQPALLEKARRQRLREMSQSRPLPILLEQPRLGI